MPARTKKACRKPGCPGTTRERHGYCEKHADLASWGRWQKLKGSAAKRGYGSAWRKLRQVILARDGYLCQECRRNGIITAGNHVDHIISKARGGDDSHSNLQTLCKPCHERKTATEGRG